MRSKGDRDCLSRRTFLKAGVVTAAASAVGLSVIGKALDAAAADSRASEQDLAYRTLGRTGLKPTVVAFGAMLTPDHEVIRAGFDLGINYVDTARRYLNGRSEGVVGKALKGIRDKVYVATKIAPASITKKDMFRDVETSLTQLQTDRIDVIQLHGLESKDRAFIPEVREALTELRKQGKVRFFGVTTHTNQAQVINGIADDPDKFFDTVLVAYNFKSSPEIKLAIARAAKTGMGIIAMKTQTGGYKTDAMGSISPHQAALKWALQDTNVTTSIPGMRDMSMLQEDFAVMRMMKMTSNDAEILRRYSEAIGPYYCHLCGQCEAACPRNVAISVINRSLMYAEGYGEIKLARATYGEVGKERSAAACVDCAGCTARCVNGINITERMDRARTLFA
jgi:predicted aldo/keto reductase-like oxidoreductase